MPQPPVPIERLQARGMNGKTLGGRDLDVIEVNKRNLPEPPPVPDGLSVRGTAEWTKIWQAGYWLWPDQDYAWVEMIARAYDDMARFRSVVEEEGLTVQGYNGQTVAHPLIAEIRKLENVIQKNLSTIGFSPTDRARLKLTEAKAEKAAQDLIPDRPATVQGYVEGAW